jgi:hypothetical protein
VPEELERIILSTLEKKPQDRYQSMAELHDALLGYMQRVGIAPVSSGFAAEPVQRTSVLPSRTSPVATPARGTTVTPGSTVQATHLLAPEHHRAKVVAIAAGAVAAVAMVAALVAWFPRRSGYERPRSGPQVERSAAAGNAPGAAAQLERSAETPRAVASASAASVVSDAAPPRAPATDELERTAPPAPPPGASAANPPRPVVHASNASAAQTSTRRSVAGAARTDQVATSSGTPSRTAAPLAVSFQCNGAPEVCAALRSAMDDAMEKAALRNVRTTARADVLVTATVAGVEGRASTAFQTTFAVRTYSIEVNADAVRTGEALRMPGPTSVSYDPTYGSERVAETARVVAAADVEKLQAYASRRGR